MVISGQSRQRESIPVLMHPENRPLLLCVSHLSDSPSLVDFQYLLSHRPQQNPSQPHARRVPLTAFPCPSKPQHHSVQGLPPTPPRRTPCF